MTSDERDQPPAVRRSEDGELLARHSRGDQHAFADFVACYRRPVYGYLVRCGVDEATREDLFQEVFTRIHRAAASYRPERPVKPWVRSPLPPTSRSHFRRARDGRLPPDDPSAEAAPTCALVEARETAAWLQRDRRAAGGAARGGDFELRRTAGAGRRAAALDIR